MKLLLRLLHHAALLLAIAVLLSGCASFKSEPLSSAQHGTNTDARTLADPGLKRFIETNLKRRLEPWPLKSWDLPMLILAAQYFRPDLENGATWQVQACVRTNLLHHVAARRRLDLLNNLSEFQNRIIDRGGSQLHTGISREKLSTVHTQFAQTIVARLDTLEQVMQSREHLAEALGLPIRALVQVEVTYDFSRGARHEFDAADLQRLALQNRSDTAEIDRGIVAHQESQARLAARIAKLSTRKRERDALAVQAKDGANAEIEMLLLETRLAAARLVVFDAQVQFQHTLGSLEDAARQPVELWGVVHKKHEVVSIDE